MLFFGASHPFEIHILPEHNKGSEKSCKLVCNQVTTFDTASPNLVYHAQSYYYYFARDTSKQLKKQSHALGSSELNGKSIWGREGQL